MKTTTLVLSDQVNCRFLGLDPLTRKKFNNALKFMVPYARHTPQFKLKRWDGKISFGSLGGTTFINMLDRVLPLILAAGYTIELDDQRPDHPFGFPVITADFVADRRWPDGHELAGTPIRLRDYQVTAINGFFQNHQSVQQIATGAGKAQPYWSKIKTPLGWITMAEATIGTIISTPDGNTAPIIGVFPQGRKPIYRLTFKDGRTADASGDHLWKIYCVEFGKPTGRQPGNCWKTLTTDKIADRLTRTQRPMKIPVVRTAIEVDAKLPMDPYVLGVLLGDGGLKFSAVVLSSADNEILESVSNRLLPGYELRHSSKYDYRLTLTEEAHKSRRSILGQNKNGIWHHYRAILMDLDLCVGSDCKFIPPMYLDRTSENQRLELLRGLLDTDGHVGKNGEISFSSTSLQLATDVMTLVRSIGGLAQITSRLTHYTYNGEVRTGKRSFTVRIRHRNPRSLVSLPRKQNRVSETYQYGDNLLLEIVSVDYIGDSLCQCIAVDHPDHLYITDDYVVTHNTLLTACLSLAIEAQGRSIVIVPSKDLVRQTEADYRLLGLDVGVYFGERKERSHRHTICTWQSLAVFSKNSQNGTAGEPIGDFLANVVCVIVDEVHTVKGVELKNLLCGPMAAIPLRWGLTGTIPKEEFEFLSLLSALGPVVGGIRTDELQGQGVLANCAVEIVQLEDDHVEFSDWDAEYTFLTSDPDRLAWIGQFCADLSQHGNTLILVERRATGLALEKLIQGAIFVYGKTKSKARAAEYASIQTATNKVIVATYGIASTGINMPRLFNLVLFHAGKAFTRVIQSAGRGLRIANDKDYVAIKDLTSTLKYSKRHLTKRKEYYNEAGFPFSLTKVHYR